ncbi:MAG: ATP-binding protein [Sulfuricurvum sp.]|nr:ATP-binding protein [Sulfuricurvum sp.]
MSPHDFSPLSHVQEILITSKGSILQEWVGEDLCASILERHEIDQDLFIIEYAESVFDYFMGVVSGEMMIGECPVIADLIQYLKNKELRADELFVLCTHFKRSVLNATYLLGINNQEIFVAISYLFDRNFAGVLKLYTDTIYQKEQEIAKNVKLLGEYKNAIDESAIVAMTNDEGNIIYANDNLVSVCGYRRDELLGRTHSIIRHTDMPADFFEELWKTITSGAVFKGTFKNCKKNGDYYYVDTTIVPIVDPLLKTTEYISIGYEVTKLIDATQSAIEAGRAKEYFLSNMSHEIRTPLNAVLGFVSLLKDETVVPRHQKYLDIIENSGENLLHIINDILDFSKLRSGEFTIDPQPFNIHDEISHIMELFVPSAHSKNIVLTSFIDPSIPYQLFSDALRIKQIVGNFLSNSIKFSEVDGAIHVEACYEKGELILSVCDHGIGIASGDQERIFNAFSQAQTAGKVNGGTGLGLSICKQLAEHMDGGIELESDDGMGSLFTLRIPVQVSREIVEPKIDVTMFRQFTFGLLQYNPQESYKVESLRRYWECFGLKMSTIESIQEECDLLIFLESSMDESGRNMLIEKQIPSVVIMDFLDDRYDHIPNIIPLTLPIYCTKLHSAIAEALGIGDENGNAFGAGAIRSHRQFEGHVLVAEDNEANQELIKIILKRHGLSFQIATDGTEAVELFKKEKFDLVLMDEQMPFMNGNEATAKIRHVERESNRLPALIAALTANVIKGSRERALSHGYDAFVGKPIDLKEIQTLFERSCKEIHGVTEAVSETMDMERLKESLLLDASQIRQLLNLFHSKMEQILPELENMIQYRNYERMAYLAHSIKGSSANFRYEELSRLAGIIEESATEERSGFDFEKTYEGLMEEYQKVYS